MKFIVAICFSFLFLSLAKAGGDKYITAMGKNIFLIDSAKSLADFQNVTNSFERIASAEKQKWLPYYYASYCCAISSFLDTAISKKDTYLDRADEYVNIADSLKQDNSEIYTLKGLISQMRLMVNPMARWQKYGPLANKYFKKAKELDPTNPRPDYLIGQSLLYTPVQFGGGKEVARPILEESMEKYESFKLENSISPDWGKKMLKNILDAISSNNKK